MPRAASFILLLALTACARSDRALKEQAARFCRISPDAITLWNVRRDPTTREPGAIASSGDHNDCVEDWKAANSIMTTHY